MTQQCKYDEQVLDYLYEELDGAARTAFTSHLSSCDACQKQLDSFGQVRSLYAELPEVNLSPESSARMTALLMKQAAEVRPATAAPVAAGSATEGGKLLALRPRGLKRVLWHPASGLMAVAAAALFYVSFRSPLPNQRSQVVISDTPSIGAPAGAVATKPTELLPQKSPEPLVEGTKGGMGEPTPTPSEPTPDKNALAAAELAEDAKKKLESVSKLSADTARGPVAAAPQKMGKRSGGALAVNEPPAARSKAKSKDDLDALTDDRNWAKPPPPRAGADKSQRSDELAAVPKQDQAPLAKAEEKAAAHKDAERERKFAEPPPPRPSLAESQNSVKRAFAQTEARRSERMVEALANQELGTLPGHGGAGAPPPGAAPPPPPPPAQAAPADTYAQRYSPVPNVMPSSGEAPRAVASGQGYRNQPELPQNVAPTTPAPEQNVQRRGIQLDGDAGSAQLATVHEHLRNGRCLEANTALRQLEQSFPATRGLGEARAQWQEKCQTRTLERNFDAQEAPAPAAMPSNSQSGRSFMQQVSKMRAPAKKAAAPAKAAKPAAADKASAF